jgi:N-acetylmuramoyl-L-alanine amidase
MSAFNGMRHVEQTKLRLIQEAIQSNVETAPRIRIKALRRRKPFFSIWLASALMAVGLGYLAVPAHVVSTGNASSAASKADLADASVLVVNQQAPTPEIPLATPQRLNRTVFPLAIKRIVIDPGHGGRQTGAISESGVTEKAITLDIGLRLRRLMQEASFDVMMTRETDLSLPLGKRVEFANANSADIFISIHVNSVEPREMRLVETYFVGPTDDPAVIKLASMENHESGYSLSDYRRLLEQVYIDTRRDESRRLAKTTNNELYRSLSQLNPVLQNRGVKMAPFAVLVGTQMPAILVEVSCLSNEDEVKLLTSEDYREKIALAISQGIRLYAESLNGTGRKDS